MRGTTGAVPIASTSARVVEDWCIPASRSPSPNHATNLACVRAHVLLVDAPRVKEGRITRRATEKQFPALVSTKFKGAFERSPWRMREAEEYRNVRGRLPNHMEEWEEWEALKREKENRINGKEGAGTVKELASKENSVLGAAFIQDTGKGKRREKRKSISIVEPVLVPGAAVPRRSASLTSHLASTKPTVKSSVKPRRSQGSSGQPFMDIEIISPARRLTSTPSHKRPVAPLQPKASVSPKKSMNDIDLDGAKSPFESAEKWAPGEVPPRRSLGMDEVVLFEVGHSQMIIDAATQGPSTANPKFPPLSFPANLLTSTPLSKQTTPQLRNGSEDSMLAAPANISTSPILGGEIRVVEQPRGSNGSITVDHFGRGSGGAVASGSKGVDRGTQEAVQVVEEGGGMTLSRLGGASTNSSANLFAEEAEITTFLHEQDFC